MKLFVIQADPNIYGGDAMVSASSKRIAEEALNLCNKRGTRWSQLRPVNTNHERIEPTVEALLKHLDDDRPVYLFDKDDAEVFRITQTALLK